LFGSGETFIGKEAGVDSALPLSTVSARMRLIARTVAFLATRTRLTQQSQSESRGAATNSAPAAAGKKP
jgi:hypothetical protein